MTPNTWAVSNNLLAEYMRRELWQFLSIEEWMNANHSCPLPAPPEPQVQVSTDVIDKEDISFREGK